jgi:hypothetical protein
LSRGRVIGGVGTVAVVASMVLDWLDSYDFGVTQPFDLPAAFLVDWETSSGEPRLGVVMVVVAVFGVLGVVLRQRDRLLRFGAGLAGTGVAALFVYQVFAALDYYGDSDELFGTLGAGVYVALAGGLGLLVSGIMRPSAGASTASRPQ